MNKEEKKEYDKKYYLDNRERILKNSKIYNLNHKKEKKKRCVICHKEFIVRGNVKTCNIECNKIYKKKYVNKYRSKKYNSEPIFKLKSSIYNRVHKSLRGVLKSTSSIKLLDCSIEFYRKHLESQFDKNMSWENYGNYWEIDHIIPLNTFNLSKSEEQQKAFYYSNTRPLEKSINRNRPKNGGDIYA